MHRRYHIGRHVGNLQVTNTYEGTFVREHLISSLHFSNLAAGYSHTHIGQSNNRCPSVYVRKHIYLNPRRFRGGKNKGEGIHYTHSRAQKQHNNSNQTTLLQNESRVGCAGTLFGLQASVLRKVGSTHGRPIISNTSFSDRGYMSRESRRRVLEISALVCFQRTGNSHLHRRAIKLKPPAPKLK